MDALSHLLIVTRDAELREELASAVATLGEAAPLMHVVGDVREARESLRVRSPALVLVELGADLAKLKAFAAEVAAASTGAAVAAVFRPDAFPADVAESAVLIEALRAGVSDFLRRPVSSRELEDLLRRSLCQTGPGGPPAGKLVSFISNKGGVGKSTLAVNTACLLATRHPGRVLLVDASLQLGVAASLLDLRPAATLTDAARESSRIDETLLRQLAAQHESGLHLLAAPSSAIEAAEIDDEVITRVLTVARRAYDMVVVDTFPLLDRVVMAVLDQSDRAYVVLENVVPTLQGGVKLMGLLESLGYATDKRRLVLNRCASIAGGVSPADVAIRLGQGVDHALPYDKRVLVAANTGRPVALTPAWLSRFDRELRRLTDDVESLLPPAQLAAHANNGQPNRNGRLSGPLLAAAPTHDHEEEMP